MGTSRKRRSKSKIARGSGNKTTATKTRSQGQTPQSKATSVTDKFVTFVRGDETKYKAKPRTEGYFARPLAPAPWPVFTGVFIVVTLLLGEVSRVFHNDYLRAFGCFFVIAGGAAILDFTGRRRAAKAPHPLYKAEKLPTGQNNNLKIFLVMVVLVLVITYATIHAQPGTLGSPLPYFLAAEFFILLMPQLLAYREIRRYNRNSLKKQ